MTNHPNRGWRRAAQQSALVYVLRHDWPPEGVAMLTREQMQKLMHEAFVAGYEAGRDSRKPKDQP